MTQETKTITEAIKTFLWHCRFEKGLDEKTIQAYRVDLRQVTEIVGEQTDIFALMKTDIKQYLQSIAHFKHKTIKRKVATLRSMLNYLECEYDDYINPMRKMQIKMKEPMRLPIVMTIEEIRHMIDFLYLQPVRYAKGTYSYMATIRNIAVIELLFASGMRVSELCNLRNKDVDMASGEVRVIGKGNKERIIQVCQLETLQALRQWIEIKNGANNPQAPFFINRLQRGLSTQSVRQMVRHIVSVTGIEKHVTPHTFRHTFATLLLEEDVDVRYIQCLLGHSSIATTQIYTHVNPSKQRQILQSKHPRRRI
ncbi:MAG: tyrosine-type recombinase/integrase [Bacteroides sp.]|nr:tyrosine-type recombinase/integrase [Bacteroides sp.]MCM1084915.1 tyrosine-type recombinase/integrase [Bacteroides sp.]MCM1169816.1 tyrosine-type recombinase/integrase [Bacteroides sp.]